MGIGTPTKKSKIERIILSRSVSVMLRKCSQKKLVAERCDLPVLGLMPD